MLIVLGLSASITPIVSAASSDESVDALVAGMRAVAEFEIAQNELAKAKIPKLKTLAKKGDTEAQLELAKYYYKGRGIEQDYSEALTLFSKAADKENAEALYYIGEIYNRGQGVPKDQVYALIAYIMSDELGYQLATAAIINADMELNAGEAYYYENENQNYQKALFWFKKAVDKNNDWAHEFLGDMYYEGKGVPKDYSKAFNSYLIVATNKEYDSKGKYKVGEMYYLGQGIRQNDKKAFEWFEKSAANNNFLAQARVGEMYYQGKGVSKNYTKAFEFFHTTTHRLLTSALNSATYGTEADKKAYIEESKISHIDYEQVYKDNSKTDPNAHLELKKTVIKWFSDVCDVGNLNACVVHEIVTE